VKMAIKIIIDDDSNSSGNSSYKKKKKDVTMGMSSMMRAIKGE